MTTFATIDPAAATFALHPTEADARRATAPLTATQEADLEALTGSQAVALFAATAAPLGIDPVKRFASKGAAARRIWNNLAALSAAAPAKVKAKPAAKPRRSRGINLAPKAEAKPCRAGTKQAVLVDLLSRVKGATMAELLSALGNWKPVTVKSGLSWDMNAVKGYGIRTTKRGDADCYHLVLPEGLAAPLPHTPARAKAEAGQ